MDNLSYLTNAHASYIESLYKAYQDDPASVEVQWQKFFEGYDLGQREVPDVPPGPSGVSRAGGDGKTSEHFIKEIRVLDMINGFRARGHLFTKTNPVRERRKYYPGKELETFGLSEADLDTVFDAGVQLGLGPATLRDIYQLLEDTYCQSIGVEYRYIRNPLKMKWFEDRMELTRNHPNFTTEQKKRILDKLNQAVIFENFLHTKFLGQKRFSLEGAESLIPALDAVVEKGSELGIEEFVIGMAHRGRLNVLANILNKTYKEIFSEFEGKSYSVEDPYGGDVKYHLGYSNDVETVNGRKVHLSLCPNPSHLEAVDPVAEGMSRAKIDFKFGGDLNKLAPILIHGDASIAGQGVVYEVVQMAKLEGYRAGGTIHLVINNQVGFTTNFRDGRSSTYCTDIAKVTLSPVFHVNGDDAEALVYAIQMAMEYRQQFHNDVFIDILCYRKYGHNESDEPKFTQPTLYKAIAAHPNPREIYVKKLIDQGNVDASMAKEMEQNFRKMLQERLDEVKHEQPSTVKPILAGAWSGYRYAEPEDFLKSPETGVDEKTTTGVGVKMNTLPGDKKFFKKIERLYDERMKMIRETKILDWAMGELLAYGTLALEGHRVRVSGQDVERGTFSHRHAIVKVEDSDEEYIPLDNLSKDQAPFEIYNSHLSEYGVLGFEYGYAMALPDALVVWEAQFGDFGNGAQVIIDQFLASAEKKWKRQNGTVLLLPHGYEGQGPEHSSARPERFLELSAENNMQIVNCSNPAQLFHVLRRQLKRDFRKPLVIFTPKSLLRHPKCVSPLKDFTKGRFQEVIDDKKVTVKDVKRVLLCSGKVYYDLAEAQDKEKRKDVAVVRVEQLYPTPIEQIEKIRDKYKHAKEFFWVQEEPENMGAWPYISRKFRKRNLDVICRLESSSPATGYAKQHSAQQLQIIGKAFELPPEEVSQQVKATVHKTARKAVKTD